ncbi:uridine permease Fui1 [Ophiocordyceps camponoti-floridani]|uniref:Uridine permease Fui1 n=1 Tax=Ophiocordyceps camponoti-floridani TaxID=2030778 RepID=A0A8H4Q7J5_9HYPO|nr:uridine permease Fui1 [Ophiocordyceps camponoti-floridani]
MPGLSSSQLMVNNHDLKPVERQRRLWGTWNFVGFWVADSFNINTWMISSSMITAGLSWWQAWICIWVGYSISGALIVSTGRIGAVYHIGFPVANRASFGTWGSLWPVFNRAAMACVWYGLQSYIGGQVVYLMIRAMSKSWDRDRMPGPFDTGVTSTPEFVSFVIFWLCSLPALWYPVHKIRHLFTFKAYLVPPAALGFLAWAIVRAGGAGPILRQPSSITGSELAWEMVRGIMTSIANFSTLIVNDCDFTRFARKPVDALWSQLLGIPLCFAITSFIGIIVSSSSTVIYDESIWNPVHLLGRFLDDGESGGSRFGVFFIAFAFALAQLGTNIAANSVSAGSDLTALLPRYINIRRGGYICAVIGLAMCPYSFLTSANRFTTYLSAYSVFLSSIAGVIITDYYFVRRGFLDVGELYHGRRTGTYFYNWGFNFRAYAAYISGILINVVGFAGAVGRDVPKAATYLYRLDFFCGLFVSSAVYWLLCRLFPVPGTSAHWMEVGEAIEESVEEGNRVVSDGSQERAEQDGGEAALSGLKSYK